MAERLAKLFLKNFNYYYKMGLSIDAHKKGGGGIKVDPPSKIFKKLSDTNTVKAQKVYPPPKKFTTPIYPPPKNCQKPHEFTPLHVKQVIKANLHSMLEDNISPHWSSTINSLKNYFWDGGQIKSATVVF
jgi:hypothetical protein